MKVALFILLVLALGTLGVNGEDGQMMQGKNPSDTYIRALRRFAGKRRSNVCSGLPSCSDPCCHAGRRCVCLQIQCES
uniref:Conotoxin n=1 Tax=Conus betulinus TaxID=89764 RepID=A0A1P7ZCR5_CONBE|nr:Conotoxin [Conus betulinus]